MWAAVTSALFNRDRRASAISHHKASNHHPRRYSGSGRHVELELDGGVMTDADDDTEGTLGDVDTDNEKVVINVGGIRHQTCARTLASKPGTRLSYLARKLKRGHKGEFFFDRHPGVFNTVMDYYRSGELHVPLDVCGAVVKRELDFWMIDDCFIEACCWTSYSSYIDNSKNLSDFNQSVTQENEELEMIAHMTGWKKKQMEIWLILDHPRSSRLALCYAVASFVFVLASITGFCIETLPDLRQQQTNAISSNTTDDCGGVIRKRQSNQYLEYLDYICTSFFTVELAVRLMFAPSKINFIRSIMNIIDMLALLPLYVQIILDLTDRNSCLRNKRAVVEVIFILRIIRVFRIFHLVKHYKALKILVHAIKASVQELMMLLIFLFIAMLIFSTLIFYAERHQTGELGSDEAILTIPMGLWWSIITMTTVGYGDVYPTSPLGCVIGAVCALCGVLLVALTIPVISNNFALFYLHARTREQIAEKDITARDRLAYAKRQVSKKKIAAAAAAAAAAEHDSPDAAGKRALLSQQDSVSSLDGLDDGSSILLGNCSSEGDVILADLNHQSEKVETQNETSI